MKIRRILILLVVSISSLLLINKEIKKEENKVTFSEKEIKSMISYTIDGNSTTEKPSKEAGYTVSKIECEKGSNVVWDNTNWQVELQHLEHEDVCTVDFTKTPSTGYNVKIETEAPQLIDSLSKSTISGGDITFYLNWKFDNITGCKYTQDGKEIKISNVTSNQTCTITFPSFITQLLKNNTTITERSDFSTAFSTAGLYVETNKKFIESDGRNPLINRVFYFAGDTQDNWVKFGKEGNSDIWWRIIRTNEDGSVRLLYAGKDDGGTKGYATQKGYINKSAYNSTYTNTMYVGYMYGTTGGLTQNRTNDNPSTIKGVIDSWYATNMNGTDTQGKTYSSYISRTAIYCNDRATSSYNASSKMYYAGYYRLNQNKRPSFKCGNNESGELYKNSGSGSTIGGADVADRFTGSQKGSTKVGNEKLGDKPIALMTADEVAYAGGLYNTNNSSAWYYQNSKGDSVTGSTYWWTMSPYFYSGSYADVFLVHGLGSGPGRLDYYGAGSSHGVRPVVSLKSCVSVSGKGTTTDPYIPSIDGTCALADN